MRFASREKAVLAQLEVGAGVVPGGGCLEVLPQVTGRSRALEIVLGGQDFDADTAERYGWINRSIPDDQLDAFVDDLAGRIASFNRSAVAAAKRLINQRSGILGGADMVESAEAFQGLLGSPEGQRRITELMDRGFQTRGDLEWDLARHLGPTGS
ncbi:enoyl-CoA hydratase/isomerase family protein [Streptomyces sp. TS71-3]|uniref:enoyl-CoA hydratase/isomerase family protein n=1 Tax=Streptomyces sp. TS71-3 TaxID=2733862 RepID=UPI001B01F93B|nr:enoyl-CoA hydratase-related protein [Streptomyces sp. TS71-3]GHJ42637.1 hypothetical protein Sm713_82460 [Streptomyces sp. TS71-3]